MAVKYNIVVFLGKKMFFACLVLFSAIKSAFAQDPVLPATNLGLTNVKDALSPPPGLYYINYTQLYSPKSYRGELGMRVEGVPKVGYLLSLHQLIYLTKIRVLDGNLYFTALQPLVKLSAVSRSAPAPSVNPNVLGDLVLGTGIQWRDKKLFDHSFWHRVEFDVNFPTGSYSTDFAINPSGNLYTLSLYYTFSFFLSPHLSFGSRNQINYNFNQLNSKIRPGTFYNGNFSIEYNPTGSFNFGIVGYYLRQFNQDSKNGNYRYFQDEYGTVDTREQVLGLGPSLSLVTGGGIFIEAKMFFESKGKNRAIGNSPTLRIAIPLKLKH